VCQSHLSCSRAVVVRVRFSPRPARDCLRAMNRESAASENRKPIVRLRLRPSNTDSILHAFVARDKILLADVSVHPSEEVCSTAQDLLYREPTVGWDALSSRRNKIKGLSFHVYELMQGSEPQIWTFACVYDSKQVNKKSIEHFVQSIVRLTEEERYCNETWRQGEYRACRDAFAPTLLEHMQQVNCYGKNIDNGNLDYSQRIIQLNHRVLSEIAKRKKETERNTKDMGGEFEEDNKTVGFSVKEVYLDAAALTGSLSDESESCSFSSTSLPTNSRSGSGSPSSSFDQGAVRVIQRRWRGFLVRQKYATLKTSIIWMQRVFRGRALHKKALLQYQSALCLKKHYLEHPGHCIQPQDKAEGVKQATDAQDHDTLEESHKAPPSPLSVLELLPDERISRIKERNSELMEDSSHKPLEYRHEDGKSRDSIVEEGKHGDGHFGGTVSSLLTTMKLASLHNQDRTDTLKKSHAHLTQSLAAGEYHDKATFQDLERQRDQALSQVAHVIEQLAEIDAENGHLKDILRQTQKENATLKDQLAKQEDNRLIKRMGRRKKVGS